jgi:16S rRNA (guanine966-N2)-methyltransferase
VPEAGRVITGQAGGLRLEAPGAGTRPVSDRVKQALFAMLSAPSEDAWSGSVLDLFSGSGALAIEALSRGAPRAVLVERDPRAAAVIERNLRRTGLAERARIVRREVAGYLAVDPATLAEAPFGLVFIDPPYERASDLAGALATLGSIGSRWLVDDAVVVAKHFWKTPPPDRVGGLAVARVRRFGETALSVYRRVADTVAGGD